MVTLDYLNDIREQLDQWKVSCYQQIDDVYEQVQKEINIMVEKHRNQIIERAANNLESIKQNSIRIYSPVHSDEEQITRKSYSPKKPVRPPAPILKRPADKGQIHRRTLPKYKSYHDRVSHLDERSKKT
ncbi:unnamed protein product [Adineta ricciae]|uniref:Uncharacterized protein n=1 Tax=Adineta ricciae TaxID=249248 RepID=A0A814T5H6_ADIRI|nr:unnamed protein product [Adineta ricciae]